MQSNSKNSTKIGDLLVGSIYPLYVNKVVRKGRSEEELLEVFRWFTGLNNQEIQKFCATPTTFESFFNQCSINPRASFITGVICGIRVETIEDELTQKVRYLDKLVDELAKGKPMTKILR